MATDETPVRGVIVLDAAAGRALRQHGRLPCRREVLDCAGEFAAGDRVWVTMRNKEGAQAVLARACAARDADGLRTPTPPGEGDAVVLQADDLDVLWRPPASTP